MTDRHYEFRNELMRVMKDGKAQARVVSTDIEIEAGQQFIEAFLDWAEATHPAAFQVVSGGPGRCETTWEPEAAKAAMRWIRERWEAEA